MLRARYKARNGRPEKFLSATVRVERETVSFGCLIISVELDECLMFSV